MCVLLRARSASAAVINAGAALSVPAFVDVMTLLVLVKMPPTVMSRWLTARAEGKTRGATAKVEELRGQSLGTLNIARELGVDVLHRAAMVAAPRARSRPRKRPDA
jgi:hypothetical protein